MNTSRAVCDRLERRLYDRLWVRLDRLRDRPWGCLGGRLWARLWDMP